MSDFQREIADRVAAFVDDITKLARKAAMDTLTSALAEAAGGANGARGRRGGRAAVALAAPRGRRGAGTRAKGEKRSPDELVRITEALNSYIKENPGQRIEQIKKSLGYDTKDLVLPVRKLLGAGNIRAEGEKRSTTYYPGDGKAPEGKRRRRRK